MGVDVEAGPSEPVGVGVDVIAAGVGDRLDVATGDVASEVDAGGVSLSGDGRGDGPTSDVVGRGDSGKVAVGGCVAVAAASMTLRVGVEDGTVVGNVSAVLVGGASAS